MGPASALTVVFSVVAFTTAAFNAWIFAVRRSEQAHLWLGVAAFGITALGVATVGLYESASAQEAMPWHRLSCVAAFPLVLGFLRFTSCFLRVDLRRLEIATNAFFAGVVAAALLRPEWLFTGEPRELVAWLGQRYVISELGWGTYIVFPVVLGVLGGVAAIYVRHAGRIEVYARAVVSAVVLWFLCAAHDLAVSAELYAGPYLIVFGYAVFALVFTAALMRRFVASVEKVEASAEVLQQLVEARTHELREKDLQLAHGARMATLGTLAAGVAHEINNPIAFISANLNQIADSWKRGEANVVDEILEETREGVERIRGIVRELLLLARRGEGVSERVDLRQVVRSVLPLLRHEAVGRARLETELGPVPEVLGDERLLGQVVLNLALNALQAIPEDASGAVVRLATRSDGRSAWLVVEDSGIGIPETVLPRIFDPFFTTKEQGKGTGLGLALTHQIVTRHRGQIAVASDAGGTRVTVELPAADAG